MKTEYVSDIQHRQLPPYDIPCHGVNIIENSQLHELLKVDHIMVNSYHHQAIKKLASEVVPMVISEDGLVEAICILEKAFVWVVQWPPSFLFVWIKIVERFLESEQYDTLLVL